MTNMSYCRFQNTLGDLRDCLEALEALQHGEEHLSRDELDVAKDLAKTACAIVEIFGDDFDLDDVRGKIDQTLDDMNKRAEEDA